MGILDLPVVDLEPLLMMSGGDLTNMNENIKKEASKAALGLHKYGLLVIKDPRATEEGNNRFLDMLERYFEQDDEVKMEHVRKQYHYQVGTTPGFTELPRNHCNRIKKFKGTDAPLSVCPPEKDPKWRFFWRVGPRPTETNFKQLNAEPVVPETIPEWKDVMDSWGSTLLNATIGVAELAAIGFGMDHDTFSKRMEYGPHLLAPTATDLYRFAKRNTVYAGYHYDLNFLTVHGKSRYPGLCVWTREGHKVSVKVPDGCLLVQAGKQFEYLTAGHVLAGFHEVVCTEKTLEAVEKAKAENRSQWRISSTLFSHIASDVKLHPVGKFATDNPHTMKNYPPVYTGDHVQAELAVINLNTQDL